MLNTAYLLAKRKHATRCTVSDLSTVNDLIWRYTEFANRCKFNRGPPFAEHCYYIFILSITFSVSQSTGCLNTILKFPEHAFLCTSYTCENVMLIRVYRDMQITLHNQFVLLLLITLKWKYVSYLPLRNEAVLLSGSVYRWKAYRPVVNTKSNTSGCDNPVYRPFTTSLPKLRLGLSQKKPSVASCW